MQEIKFINRTTTNIETEKVPAGGTLKFLYGSVFGKISLTLLVKRKGLSALAGSYMNSKASIKKIAPFIKEYGINMDDFISPKHGFKHFNDFFYRKIVPNARPIQKGIVSPADGRVFGFNTISDSATFFIKGSEFNLTSFLQDKVLANKFKEGSMVIIRLAPVDYHRYHFPVDGLVSDNKKIKGSYYSVSPFALRKSLEIFCQNKREYCTVNTQQNGEVLICDVGATMTGGIIQTYTPNTHIEKGSEKGYFAFGGSTLVLLFEKGKAKLSDDILSNTKNGYETYLKMGETIGE
jgi:phosphatidylserine decarboxylase